ncbi:class I SAM-dependent methyltransferase [Ideonella sp.]|uniref:class I SAM-dependent methyltransferase n=1 Tax=Ideonella sp. TaxID=1929293 RepID=UPI003BB5D014
MSITPQTMRCGVCGNDAKLLFTGYPCFGGPGTFDVMDCGWCETRFAHPLAPSDAIYDLIYQNAHQIPGYDRYQRYATNLPKVEDPLAYMAKQEDVYWAVNEAVSRLSSKNGRPLRILEIGSGFGYLTFALRKRGHDCRGIDISQNAVAKAVADFGSFYQVADLMNYEDATHAGYDVIVATELIEHLVDPVSFLRKAGSLLRPGGSIVLTTPNKDLYSDKLAWHTDPAPVHLWWFSKTSLRKMAWDLRLDAQFIDFSEFYGNRVPAPMKGPSKPQTFSASGEVVYKDSVINTVARKLMAIQPGLFQTLGKIFVRKVAREKMRDGLYRESLSLCVMLHKRNDQSA